MKNINWKVRLRNPVFLAEVGIAVLVPILSYAGLTAQDLTSWAIVGQLLVDALSNPYVLSLIVVSVFNAVNDPTVSGIKDSPNALSYRHPNKNAK